MRVIKYFVEIIAARNHSLLFAPNEPEKYSNLAGKLRNETKLLIFGLLQQSKYFIAQKGKSPQAG